MGIANRGEIACRIIRSCRELGVRTVAVYSDADANSLHVQMADEAFYLGPSSASESYLVAEKILNIAHKSNSDAIHPGYGFLSENSEFCQQCFDANIEFIGPPVQTIQDMGSKSASKRIMEASNIPVVPGYYGKDQTIDRLKKEAKTIGYPVMIKAVLGRGEKGMRVVETDEMFETLLEQTKGEAMSSFADENVLLERYIKKSRHIEFQIFGDKYGNIVHLFERDCSVRRRNQKILEESPAPGVSENLRKLMGQSAVEAAKAVNYVGAGTVEFIIDVNTDEYFFMKMNTKLQVEHPITEMISRQDLIQWQLHIAAGYPIPRSQIDLQLHGHAIESRIYAERTERGFLQSIGRIKYLSMPHTDDRIRIDTGIRQNDEVPVYYDPMIAKLIVWGEDRNSALQNIEYALNNFHVVGPDTNIDFLLRVVTHEQFKRGQIDTSFMCENQDVLLTTKNPSSELLAFAILGNVLENQESFDSLWSKFNGFRLNSPLILTASIKFNKEIINAKVQFQGNNLYLIKFMNSNFPTTLLNVKSKKEKLIGTANGKKMVCSIIQDENKLFLFSNNERFIFQLPIIEIGNIQDDTVGAKTPMPGRVVEVFVKEGQEIDKGELICLMEAMKMRHEIRSNKKGTIKTILYQCGDFVESDQLLVEIEDI